jgi:thiaminase/transcriptional activator TenA
LALDFYAPAAANLEGRSYSSWAEVARWMRKAIDQLALDTGAVERSRMEAAFVISSRYEWSFWEMAWREEQWPV